MGRRAGTPSAVWLEAMAPERVASLFLPHFPIQVERERRPDLAGQPLVLISGHGNNEAVVRECSPEAAASGLKPGMPAHEIPQRCPGAILLPFAMRYYRERYDALLRALDAVTPQVEIQPLDTFYLDLSGLRHLETVEQVHAALREVLPRGLSWRLGVARGKFTSWVAAHQARTFRPLDVEHGEEPYFLDPAPSALLPVSPETLRRLHLLGLRTLGQVRRLPRSAMLAQFGHEGERAHRLACGEDREPLVPYAAPVVVRESFRFEEAAPTLAQFHLALSRLVQRVCARPERGNRGIRTVRLEAALESGGLWERTVTLRQPREQPEAIIAELLRRLESVRPTEPLTELSVEIAGFAPRLEVQTLLFPNERQERRERLARALEQLRERLHCPAVYRIVEVQPCSKLPEKRHALLSYEP